MKKKAKSTKKKTKTYSEDDLRAACRAERKRCIAMAKKAITAKILNPTFHSSVVLDWAQEFTKAIEREIDS